MRADVDELVDVVVEAALAIGTAMVCTSWAFSLKVHWSAYATQAVAGEGDVPRRTEGHITPAASGAGTRDRCCAAATRASTDAKESDRSL